MPSVNKAFEVSFTNAYLVSMGSVADIVRTNVQFCKKFNVSVNNQSVSLMFMLPNFHKPFLNLSQIAAGLNLPRNFFLRSPMFKYYFKVPI